MIKITLDDIQAQAKIKQIAAQLQHPRKLYGVLGETLKKIHNRRFKDQKSPDGKPWAALSPQYAAYKAKKGKGNRILKFEGALSQRTAYNYDDRGVEFGSTMKYARVHQYGSNKSSGRGSGIKPRPWLGVSAADEQFLLDKATSHLRRVISKIAG